MEVHFGARAELPLARFDEHVALRSAEMYKRYIFHSPFLGFGRLDLQSLQPTPCNHKREEFAKIKVRLMSWFELLPHHVLENIVSWISAADLCRLAQVNKFCYYSFQKDAFWKVKAEQQGYCKAKVDKDWMFNYRAAARGDLFVRSLDMKTPLYYKGDVTIVDPMKIFFLENKSQKQKLTYLLAQHQHDDIVVTYRGIDTAFIRSQQEDETAFEVTRRDSDDGLEVTRKNKHLVGEDFSESGIIAAIPQRLVKILMEENKNTESVGVFLEGVNFGEIRSSCDGDFVIIRPPCKREAPQSWPCDVTERAQVTCISGGSWTYSDDSDSDECDEDFQDPRTVSRMPEHEENMSWFEYEEWYRRTSDQIC